jgi:non-ribosomal peptide synthetase component F
MARHFVRILDAAVNDPNQPAAGMRILDSEERRRILEEWNATGHASPAITLPEMFEAQVERTPDAIAVRFEDQSLTYGESNTGSNRLAHVLIERGIGPEQIVSICLERSPEVVIGLLRILKSGAAYLPLDPEYPLERLDFIVKDAKPGLVLGTLSSRNNLPVTVHILDVESSFPRVNAIPPIKIVRTCFASNTQPMSSIPPALLEFLETSSLATAQWSRSE